MTVSSAVQDLCSTIHTKIGRSWEFDARFEAALLVYSAAEENEILKAVGSTLDYVWTSGTLGAAPKNIQALADAAGGLDANQRLFHSDSDAPIIVFGTVWPWGGGAKTSLRIGCWSAAAEAADLAAARAGLKASFGIG